MNPNMTNEMSRRAFLKTTSHITASSVLLSALSPAAFTASDNTIRVALIGCGGRGSSAAANAMATKKAPVRLFAMADIFEDRMQKSYDGLLEAAEEPRTGGSADGWVEGYAKTQVDVPPERRFLGFDAYQKAMDCLRPGDVAILTTPVAFRWVHFRYAIQKGLHVFMEKPIAVDSPTTRRIIQLGEEAKKKNLKVGVGLMCRHCSARRQLHERIRSGQIGEILTLRTYRQQGPAGFVGPRPAGQNELLWQIRNYLGFFWASGGLMHDYVSHTVDECCWMKGSWPVRAQGSGARCYRGDCVDQNFDMYDVEYTFADGTKLFQYARNINQCHTEFASYAHGTKGAAVISTFIHTPAKCRIYTSQDFSKDNLAWAFPQPEPNPYQVEWDELIEAILKDTPFNEVQRGAESGLVTIMGRRAVHTGQIVTFEEMLKNDIEFAPNVDHFTMDSPAPLLAAADGKYPTPQPGILSNREF